MAKNLKLNIKNTQLAEALQLKKKAAPAPAAKPKRKAAVSKKPPVEEKPEPIEAPAQPPVEEKEVAPATPPVREKETPPSPPPKKEEKKKSPPRFIDDIKKPVIKRRGAAPAPPKKPSAARAEKPAAPAAPKHAPSEDKKKGGKGAFFKDYRDARPKTSTQKRFDARDRQGLRAGEEERWRSRRPKKTITKAQREELAVRPKELSIRLPVTVKELASQMKLKSSQLIQKLFMQGVAVTINDLLDDETTIQLLGHEFECEIIIDTSEEERIQITDKTVKEEIAESDGSELSLRPPVITFMGHVDHGKTSLIDAIRATNVAEGEAGAITQHIGAFKCKTDVGEITILDTPGHEAFSAMRERGAEATDLVVLVIAGDEGMRDQTIEAMNSAKESNVPIVVAINKSDKPGFNPDDIYRQLSEHELLPEAWGGQTITVNCSAKTGEGIKELLEMLSLQSEVLELKANPNGRARGSVIESAMHKGLGHVATVLVQNGTLKIGDSIVIDIHYAKIKTMHDEHGTALDEATPSTPVKITGLSGLPEAGSEFIVLLDEKEAKLVAEARAHEYRTKWHKSRKRGLESFMEKQPEEKKVLHVILRADVQGSLEALKHSLEKIKSDKAELNIVAEGIGQVSESDIELAAASGATIVGFHTKVESHAETMIKEHKVSILLHDIIYHARDEVKEKMRLLLDKIPEENDVGMADVKAIFKSSHLGIIAGCQVAEGLIKRNHKARLKRDNDVIWKGDIASIKRDKEDVREVSKGLECGIVLQGTNDIQEGDQIEAYEITYLEQEL